MPSPPMASPSSTIDPLSRLLCEKLKALRSNQDWTLEMLSAASGVSRSMLSQIERGNANPTLAVACKIASAFDISIGELIGEPWSGSSIKVIRRNDPTHHYRTDSQCRIRTLSPLNTEKTVEFYELAISPNAELRSAPHFDGTREFLAVEKGSVSVLSGTDICKLSKGDSAHYRADLDHVISNHGKGEAVCFLVVVYI
jgi:transcriptional regulator with XRE-family HTH domain